MAKTTTYGVKQTPAGAGRTGSVIPSGSQIRNISSWADALEPRRTPILSRCKTGKAVNQIKNEWGQSYHTPISGNLGGAVANSDTTIDVGSGAGTQLQQYFVIEIIDYFSGTTRLDYTTREEVIVTSSSSTQTPTVIRDAKNRTDASTPSSGSWPTHSSGAYWAVCGVAMPYATDFALSPFTRGDLVYNYPQRFYAMASADVAMRHTPTYETQGDQLLKDVAENTMLLKWYLERTIVSGVRMEGDGSTLPYKMGGLDYFISTYGNSVNLSQNTIHAYDFEDLLRDQYKKIDDGGAKTAIMGPDTAAIFDVLINPFRQATMSDSSVNLVTDSIKFRWGTIEVMPTQHLPEGTILLVDFKDIEVAPYNGCAWSTKQLATDGPYDKIAIWGDYTLKVDRLARMGRITGINTDLNSYDRKSFF